MERQFLSQVVMPSGVEFTSPSLQLQQSMVRIVHA